MLPRNAARQDGGPLKRPSSPQQGFVASISRFWAKSYAPEYFGLAVILVAHIILGLLFRDPFHQQFILDDQTIQHPHALHERVPALWLLVFVGIIPLGCLVVWAAVFRPGWSKVHVTILGFFMAMVITTFLTDVIKNAVGMPRPDMLDRCKPKPATPAHELVTYKVCTETNHHILHDGFRSFPSGHSSSSFAGLGYMSFFLASQLHALKPRADIFRILLAFTPLLGAGLIALSRFQDYRHDVYDIAAGSILGFIVAFFAWRKHYPSLCSINCDTPYPTRGMGWNECENEASRVRDEEEMVGGAGEYDAADEHTSEEMPLTFIRR